MREVATIVKKWVDDGAIILRQPDVPPTAEDKAKANFCIYHQMAKHPTKECWALRNIFHRKIANGELVIDAHPNVEDTPYPTHPHGKAKAVNMVTHYLIPYQREHASSIHIEEVEEKAEEDTLVAHTHDMEADMEADKGGLNFTAEKVKNLVKFKGFFDQLGFPEGARLEATKAILGIAETYGDCMTLDGPPASSSRDDKGAAITFTDEDVQVSHPHNRPLYVPATVHGVEFKRGLLDGGASLNIMPLTTFRATGIPKEKLIVQPISITGFGNDTRKSVGFITTHLTLGKFSAPAKFHVIEADTSYQLLIGRTWMHKFGIIPSTYHQCMKGVIRTRHGQSKVITVNGTKRPFGTHEAHMADAEFFEELEDEEDVAPPSRPRGIAIPKWENARQGDFTEKAKRERNKSPECVRIKLPDGRFVYRL